MNTTIENLQFNDVNDIRTLTERAALRWGDKIGLIFDEHNEKLTFRDINERSNEIANALLSIGVEQGDRVAIMLKNRSEFPLTWLAIGKIGAIMVPINVYYKEFDAKIFIRKFRSKSG